MASRLVTHNHLEKFEIAITGVNFQMLHERKREGKRERGRNGEKGERDKDKEKQQKDNELSCCNDIL